MPIDIKRIIREEFSRLAEGDVIRPDFGGRPSFFIKTLRDIEAILDDAIDDEELNEEQNDMLNAMLDHVQDMMKDGGHNEEEESDEEEDEEPYGADPTESERSELSRFNKWSRDQF